MVRFLSLARFSFLHLTFCPAWQRCPSIGSHSKPVVCWHTPVVMPFAMKSILAAVLGGTGLAITTRTDATAGGNPIRKVVSMMEKMADKIEGEADKESDQYDKFDCYCWALGDGEPGPFPSELWQLLVADVDKKQSEIVALEQEVKTLKEQN
eukprot:Skav225991  [mRNA]  locus=scaffold4003:128741:145232:+ [translate_table: standard]